MKVPFSELLRRRSEKAEAEHALSMAMLEAEQAALKANSRMAIEAANIFNQDDNGVLFDLYNYSTGDAMDESNFVELQRNAYQAWATDGFARGWIECFVKFVVGRSCRLTAEDEDEETQEVLDEWCDGLKWPDGRREKPWSYRAEEWVRRTFRDGEALVRKYTNPVSGAFYIRFLNPLWIRNPYTSASFFAGEQDWSFGIRTQTNDIERALSYAYWPNGYTFAMGRNGMTEIDAKNVIHTKISDSDAKRGKPILLPVIADLVELNKLLRARRKLNWLRSLYAVEKKVKGSWPDLNRGLHNKSLTTSAVDSTAKREVAPRESTIAVHNENIEYEFKTPNLQASDADSDIRRHGLKIMVGLGLTETVGLGDASNNNYSSGELAESPMITTMRFWQGFFEPDFKQVGRMVIESAMDAGRLKRTGKNGRMRSVEVEVGFPILNPRDVEKETRALALQHEEGWVSRRTAQIKLDLNPDAEDKQLKQEMENEELQDLTATDDELRELVNNGSPGNTGDGEASAARRTRQLRGRAASGPTRTARR